MELWTLLRIQRYRASILILCVALVQGHAFAQENLITKKLKWIAERRASGTLTEDHQWELGYYSRHEDARVRRSALDAYRVLKRVDIPTLLKELIVNPEPDVRVDALNMAGRLGDDSEQLVDKIVEVVLFTQDSRNTEDAARGALKMLGTAAAPALPLVLEASKHEEKRVRINSVKTLGYLSSLNKNEVVSVLRKALRDDDSDFHRAVFDAVVNMGEDAEPLVKELAEYVLLSPGLTEKHHAAKALGRLGEYASGAVPIFSEALGHKEFGIRQRASIGLLDLGRHALPAKPELLNALGDSDYLVRANAVRTLGKFGDAAIEDIPLVIAALEDPEVFVRDYARESLGELGMKADGALKKIEEQYESASYGSGFESRGDIEKVLEKIRPPKSRDWTPSVGADGLCEALEKTAASDELKKSINFAPGFGTGIASDSWDIAISALHALFLEKMNGPSGIGYFSGSADESAQWFSDSMDSLVERIDDREDPFYSSSDIYAMMFSFLLLKHQGDETRASFFKAKLEDLVRWQKTSGIGGSAMNTYAYGASMATLGTLAPEDVANDFLAWVDSFQDPLVLPYSPGRREDRSRLSSAGRNVPVHLALLVSSPDERRITTMIEAIENWVRYSGNLLNEVSRGSGHEGPDGIAPYYFYSTLPYVTAALKYMENQLKVSRAQKKKLKAVRTILEQRLPQLMGKDGRLKYIEGGKTFRDSAYYSSPGYIYPLYGLALLPMLGKRDRCLKGQFELEYGIVYAH